MHIPYIFIHLCAFVAFNNHKYWLLQLLQSQLKITTVLLPFRRKVKLRTCQMCIHCKVCDVWSVYNQQFINMFIKIKMGMVQAHVSSKEREGWPWRPECKHIVRIHAGLADAAYYWRNVGHWPSTDATTKETGATAERDSEKEMHKRRMRNTMQKNRRQRKT